jgi:hypothetical protein
MIFCHGFTKWFSGVSKQGRKNTTYLSLCPKNVSRVTLELVSRAREKETEYVAGNYEMDM